MKEYIEREAFIDAKRKQYCGDCDRRKGMKNGKVRFCYDIGEAPCRACSVDDVLNDVEDFSAADVVEVQDALAFSQTFNLDEYRGQEDQRDCDFMFGVLMRLGIVCLKMYDPTTRTMKLWVEKVDGGVNDGKAD